MFSVPLGSGALLAPLEVWHAQEFADTRVGVGIHLQLQVPDVDAFYDHCIDAGALLSVSGEPTDQNWGWREFALRDPDGYLVEAVQASPPAGAARSASTNSWRRRSASGRARGRRRRRARPPCSPASGRRS